MDLLLSNLLLFDDINQTKILNGKSRPIRNLYNTRFLISEISLKSLKFKFVKLLVQCTLIVIIEAIRNISFRYSVRYFHDKS